VGPTPRPGAVRLWTRASNAKLPDPPFGLPRWSEDEGAIAVLIDPRDGEHAGLTSVAAQIPRALSLPAETLVMVLAAAARSRNPWVSLIAGRPAIIPRSRRCAALLARGYVAIGAMTDSRAGDIVWGWSGS